MECFALFKTAEFLGKKAACLLTVVDANYTKENLTSKQREEDLDDMIEIALESAVSIDNIKDELDEIEERLEQKAKQNGVKKYRKVEIKKENIADDVIEEQENTQEIKDDGIIFD